MTLNNPLAKITFPRVGEKITRFFFSLNPAEAVAGAPPPPGVSTCAL